MERTGWKDLSEIKEETKEGIVKEKQKKKKKWSKDKPARYSEGQGKVGFLHPVFMERGRVKGGI